MAVFYVVTETLVNIAGVVLIFNFFYFCPLFHPPSKRKMKEIIDGKRRKSIHPLLLLKVLNVDWTFFCFVLIELSLLMTFELVTVVILLEDIFQRDYNLKWCL